MKKRRRKIEKEIVVEKWNEKEIVYKNVERERETEKDRETLERE